MAAGGDGGVRDRLYEVRLTLFVLGLLFAVYLFEMYVTGRYGRQAFGYVFLANLEPSPGWVFAPFAHSLRDASHLPSSIAAVAVYGALLEPRLPDTAYLKLYVGGAYASTAAQVASYVNAPAAGTLGASGAASALVAFFALDTLFRHTDPTERPAPATTAFAAGGVAVIGVRLVRDLGVMVPAAEGTAPYGHVAGAAFGTLYAVWRARRRADDTVERVTESG